MKPNLKQHLEKTYIIGVSGGPDSMALLDMCKEQGLCVVAAHMNYDKRDTALRDEQIVREYCAAQGIPCFVEHCKAVHKGNFQAFARAERYRFYHRLVQEYHAEAVLLAHHLDDHLETYLMQKQRGSQGEWYGIKADTTVYNCHIVRPLMKYTKQQLLAYCIEHQVPYGFDESNFTNDYTRNRIRHDCIDRLSYQEKLALVAEIEKKNEEQQAKLRQAKNFLETWQQDVASLIRMQTECPQILRLWICQQSGEQVSKAALKGLCELLKKANNWTRDIGSEYCIDKEYGRLYIHKKEDISYSYVFPAIAYRKTPYFKIAKVGKSVEAVTLYPNDFPLTIRNVQQGDTIQLRLGRKHIHRWFIDRKIPTWERKRWPVVVNAKGNVILVPQIGCDIEHFSNNPSIFVVK